MGGAGDGLGVPPHRPRTLTAPLSGPSRSEAHHSDSRPVATVADTPPLRRAVLTRLRRELTSPAPVVTLSGGLHPMRSAYGKQSAILLCSVPCV